MQKIKTEIKWALVFSAVTLAWMVMEKITGLHDRYIDYNVYITNLFLIPAVWIYLLALQDKRDNFYGGKITYWQGLVSGITVSLFIALLSPLIQWITSYVISPEYFANVIKRSVEMGYYKTREEAEANFNYKNYAIQSFIWTLVMGILITSVVMIFVKSKKINHGNDKHLSEFQRQL